MGRVDTVVLLWGLASVRVLVGVWGADESLSAERLCQWQPRRANVRAQAASDAPVDLRLIDGKDWEFVAFSVGHSILNRTSTVEVGSLMLKHGGGGHKAVGTCQVPYADADSVLADIVEAIKATG